MDGKTYVKILKGIYKVQNNNQLAKALDTNPVKIGAWEKNDISNTILRNSIKAIIAVERNRFRGEDFINYAKKKYSQESDAKLAKVLNHTQPTLTNWRKNGLTIRSIFELIEKMKSAHALSVVSPIIEYYPVTQYDPSSHHKPEIVSEKDSNRKALFDELKQKNGVYAFYDSQGVCVYVGKAKRQSLWDEMNSAYKRRRGAAQAIMRVKHIHTGQFDPTIERKRQIKSTSVPLFELTRYFSAYAVQKEFIDNFEAVIIRMFANTLLNKKMEQFTHI